MSTILESRLRPEDYIPIPCPHCKVSLEYILPSPPPQTYRIRCSNLSCKRIFDPPRQSPKNTKEGKTALGGRKIGSDERPIESRYYDILGISPAASPDEIKKAYRRLAIKHHPDKNPDVPDAEEMFKEISIAYQTLSDPQLRKKYNEFGSKANETNNDFVDPEEVFGSLFGGERFADMIGQISIGRSMKEALQAADEETEGPNSTTAQMVLDPKTGKMVVPPEEKARLDKIKKEKDDESDRERRERVDKLVANLEKKLNVFTESLGEGGGDEKEVAESFRAISMMEANELVVESYGFELLQAVGATYAARGRQYNLTNSSAFGGVIGWGLGFKSGMGTFSDSISLVRAGLHLKNVFQKLQDAEKLGLSPEQMKALEEEAAAEGLKTLWKSAKLEVESVIRETCDRLLSDSAVPKEKLRLRAMGLELLGEAYQSASKPQDPNQMPLPEAAKEKEANRSR